MCKSWYIPGPKLGTYILKEWYKLTIQHIYQLLLSFLNSIFSCRTKSRVFFFLQAHLKEASFIKDSSAYFILAPLLCSVHQVNETGVIGGRFADLHTAPNGCKLLPESERGGLLETANICGLILLTHADLFWALFVSLFINVSLEWVPND